MSQTETESHHVSTDLRSNVRGSTCGNFTMYVGPRDVLLERERDIQYIGTSPIRVANMRVWCFNDKNKETRRLKQVYIELCVGGAWRAVPVYE